MVIHCGNIFHIHNHSLTGFASAAYHGLIACTQKVKHCGSHTARNKISKTGVFRQPIKGHTNKPIHTHLRDPSLSYAHPHAHKHTCMHACKSSTGAFLPNNCSSLVCNGAGRQEGMILTLMKGGLPAECKAGFNPSSMSQALPRALGDNSGPPPLPALPASALPARRFNQTHGLSSLGAQTPLALTARL